MPVTRYEEVENVANPISPHPHLRPYPRPRPHPHPRSYPHPRPRPYARPRSHPHQVENLAQNLKLKQNMWQGLHDWGEQVDTWSTAPFESLNTEAMQQSVN